MGSTFMLMNTRMFQEQQSRSLNADIKGEFSTDTKLIFGAETSTLDDKGFMDNMGMASVYNMLTLLIQYIQLLMLMKIEIFIGLRSK